jgi:protein-disulfide isomerase
VASKSSKTARVSTRRKLEAARAQEKRRAARKRNITIAASLVGVFAIVVGIVLLLGRGSGSDGTALAAGESRYVRADSHRLTTAPDGKVTLVEFLDFECGACKAAFPLVEKLRKEYEGRVAFVARYFPLPGHFNAERAARAVEAAARQGKFDAMYQQMYQTQTQWGGQQKPADDYFRSMAQGLGLDMAVWEKNYNDPATLERVNKDVADGKAVGVTGTPSFFLNGQAVRIESEEQMKAAIDAAFNS